MPEKNKPSILWDVMTPLGFRVILDEPRWNLIVSVKHPVMKGRDSEVQGTLQQPEEVRRSKKDPWVFLFYKAIQPGRWLCTVVKRLNGEGFLITAYPTDALKEGESLWP